MKYGTISGTEPSEHRINTMIFAKRLTGQGHSRQLTIEQNVTSGWIAREHEDSAIRTSLFHDWRQVEMAIALFELKALALQNQGWAEIPQKV